MCFVLCLGFMVPGVASVPVSFGPAALSSGAQTLADALGHGTCADDIVHGTSPGRAARRRLGMSKQASAVDDFFTKAL
jgi:hypothetical protein